MRTDILGHPPSLCNYRRVWHPCHTHAAFQGVQWSPLHQPTKNCTNQAATASSHSKRLLCILRVPWDNITQPKHLCASVPSVGGLFRAATRTHPGGAAVSAAPTKLPLHLPTEFTEHTETSCRNVLPQNSQNFLAEENFCVFCVFRGTILRNLNICVDLCHLWENTITAGGVGMAEMPYPPKYVLWAVHLCLVGAAETAAPPGGTSVSICEICGRTPRTLTFYVFRGRTRTVCLSTRPSST